MSTLCLYDAPVDEVPHLPADEWREAIDRALALGARVVTLFGRPDDGRVVATCVLEGGDTTLRALRALRTTLEPAVGYRSLTPTFPALHCFERELHEQHGVRVVGPSVAQADPLRDLGAARGATRIRSTRSRGKRFTRSRSVRSTPASSSRGASGSRASASRSTTSKSISATSTAAWRSYCSAAIRERSRRSSRQSPATRASPTPGRTRPRSRRSPRSPHVDEIDLARGVMLELERIAMHLAGLAGLAADIGFLQGAATYGRLRTTAINTSMRLCGSRFGRGAVRAGGSGVSSSARVFTLAELRRNLALLSDDVRDHRRLLPVRAIRTAQASRYGDGHDGPGQEARARRPRREGLGGALRSARSRDGHLRRSSRRAVRRARRRLLGARPRHGSVRSARPCAWIGAVLDRAPSFEAARAARRRPRASPSRRVPDRGVARRGRARARDGR